MTLEDVHQHGRCCACQQPLAGRGRLNLTTLERKPTWANPTVVNVLTGYGPAAVGMLCDACVEGAREPTHAVEFQHERIIYHPVESLEALPPEPTFVLRPTPQGLAIQCLLCGATSWSPSDVRQKYCGHCHRFHRS
jgi:hypothetical protein